MGQATVSWAGWGGVLLSSWFVRGSPGLLHVCKRALTLSTGSIHTHMLSVDKVRASLRI